MSNELSRLEAVMHNATAIDKGSEWHIDIVREVLLRRTGTAAQRNAILRVIKQNTPKITSNKLHRLINETIPNRHSSIYVNTANCRLIPL